jgi:hypothetical protein
VTPAALVAPAAADGSGGADVPARPGGPNAPTRAAIVAAAGEHSIPGYPVNAQGMTNAASLIASARARSRPIVRTSLVPSR